MDWFQYDIGLRHERVNGISENEHMLPKANTFSLRLSFLDFFFRYDLVERVFENLLSNEDV